MPATSETDAADGPAVHTLVLRLWREHVREHLWKMILALILMAIAGGTLGLAAYMIQPLFDLVLNSESGGGVFWVAVTISLIFVVRAVTGYAQRLLVVSVGLKVVAALQVRLMRHLLTLDMSFFQVHPPGALIERVRGDTLALQGIASNVLMSLGRDSVSLVSLLFVMFLNDWRWSLLALIGVPILVLPLYLVQRLVRGFSYDARNASAGLSTQLDEAFHGIQSIKLNRLEEPQSANWQEHVANFLRRQMRAERAKSGTPAMVDLISAVGFLAVIWVGGNDIVSGDKTVGEFMSFFTALALVLDPMRRVFSLTAQLQAGAASLQRLYELLELEPGIVPPPAPQPIEPGEIRFNDVRFGYGERPVLKGLSFSAEAGRTTALVGPSGAGKTTVFALVTRLVDPESGSITIGGTPTDAADPGRLRDMIAVVGQETALFDETIAANIRMGRLSATEEEVRAAARDASVLDFAEALPDGLETRVGPRGSALSGGQRQRVAIARAMLRDAPILLMDEPTSALDAQSERLVQEALERLSAGRTTIVIAHRLSTIRDADKIVVLDHGRVVEEGTHETLMAAGGAYARLNELQSAGLTPPL
ncbi:ATP-binding cassette domain-containing protein [Rhodobacterales bacterium HKCCE2091]|nr:ATP-binding cassette domain-containing protein [Rhodobacterales bacterium HKCCE2091]